MTWLLMGLLFYLACGCASASYVAWRFYSPGQQDRLQKVLGDVNGMGAAERRRFLVLLATPRAFLDIFTLMVMAWPLMVWRTWGVLALQHMRYRWARAKIIAEWQAQQKRRRCAVATNEEPPPGGR